MRQVIASILFFFFSCIPVALHAEFSSSASAVEESIPPIVLDNFENHGAEIRWTFNNGKEFPGAKGAFQRSVDTSNQTAYGELRFDFSEGGNYVSASWAIPSPSNESSQTVSRFGGLQVDIKRPAGNTVSIRYTDQTGQVFQKTMDCVEDRWTTVIVPFRDWDSSWGGKNDGILQGNPREIAILINHGEQTQGSLLFDNVTLLPPSSDDWMIHTQYTAYNFDSSEGWYFVGVRKSGENIIQRKNLAS